MNLFRDVAIGDGCYDDGRWTTRDCGGAGSLESALQTTRGPAPDRGRGTGGRPDHTQTLYRRYRYSE